MNDRAEDWLPDIPSICAELGEPDTPYGHRRVYRMLEVGEIPGIKLGGRWKARKSAIRAHVEQLERQALGRAAQNAGN